MRTTLAIDDDVLAVARELATTQRKSVGEVISSLARKALHPASSNQKTRNGVRLLAVRPDSMPVTSKMIRQLDEELP